VIVVAEGAGQRLLDKAAEWDASGNRRQGDIGAFLRDQIKETFRGQGISVNLKYIDPSYMIRSLPANARDAKTAPTAPTRQHWRPVWHDLRPSTATRWPRSITSLW
jgi:hypothetical protein